MASLSNVMEKYRTKVLFSPDVKGYTKENFSPDANGLKTCIKIFLIGVQKLSSISSVFTPQSCLKNCTLAKNIELRKRLKYDVKI